jgi:RHS repeat-associated protein
MMNRTILRTDPFPNYGAGGIGGLLEINDAVNGVHFVGYDGNGNVALLAKASDGSISGRYEYGPFGEVLRATGPVAKANPFRFSTKYQDDETDLVYYGRRYYNASTGRWISRDPKGHKGGVNLFAYVLNAPTYHVDPLGLESRSGGNEALKKDVNFSNPSAKIGTVEVWTEATTGPGTTHSIWIQFNRTASDVSCKWVQFVNTHVYDENEKEIDQDVAIGIFGKFFRKTKTWYVDVKEDASSAWYKPNVSAGDTESVWDEPLKGPYHKMIMEFQTCLLCRAAKCAPSTPYMPAFQVAWKRIFPYLDVASYADVKGDSVSKMPVGFQGPTWELGFTQSGQHLTVNNPIISGD